jgi:xylose isomerase
MLDGAASMDGVRGVELVGTWDITPASVKEMKRELSARSLACSSIIPDLFSQKRWGKGALTSADTDIRAQAVAEVKSAVDMASEMGCDLITLWPGQDGYDYCLSADYSQERTWLIDGVRHAARHAEPKGVRIALEYKPKEPRTHSYLARAADTLLAAMETGMENVGVAIDTGHAFMAGENVGESIALLTRGRSRLFHMHFNDNYSAWDDDLIVGSVRLVEYFELLFWLEKTGYQGWYSMDQYPYREDGRGAVHASVLFVQQVQGLLERIGVVAVKALVAKKDPIAVADFLRTNLIAH